MNDKGPSLQRALNWIPPAEWRRIVTLDAHCGGEPLRIVLEGWPELPGATILQRRRFAKERLEDWRTALMWEPRGHADMYGCIVVPAATDDGDFGVLFTHNEGYSSMCGHGIIAVVTALVDTGAVTSISETDGLKIDTPAGRVIATAETQGGRVERVSFENVPSFVVELDASIDLPELGTIRYDLAFGGAFYAYVAGQQFAPPIQCLPRERDRMVALGRRIKAAVANARDIAHPIEGDLGFLYGVIFTAPPTDSAHHSRNCCIFADGEVDRSPTGTGVSGRAAILFERGQLPIGQVIRIESLLGTCFDVSVKQTHSIGSQAAVIPLVSGQAFLTGRHEFFVDPRDPLGQGFLLR